MEEKPYTITEPCPTQGVARSSGYIPQDFSVTTVESTACVGQPMVAVTAPVAFVAHETEAVCPASCMLTITQTLKHTITQMHVSNYTVTVSHPRYWAA